MLLFDDCRDTDPPHGADRVVGHHDEVFAQHAELLVLGVEQDLGPQRIAGSDPGAGSECRGHVPLTLDGADDQLGRAGIRERESEFSDAFALFYRAEFKDISRIFAPGARFSLVFGPRVHPDSVGDEGCTVAAAVNRDLQGVTQGPVTGPVRGDEVREVDRTPFAGCDCGRGLRAEQPAGGQRPQGEADRTVGVVDVADGPLYRLPDMDIGEGVECRGQPQSASGIDRIEFLDAFRTRGDTALDGECGDLFPLAGVDRQLFGEDPRAVCGVVGDGDFGLFAGEDRAFREAGNRTAAGGHHVEDHQGPVAAVFAREGVAHGAVELLDGPEVPAGRIEGQRALSRGLESV